MNRPLTRSALLALLLLAPSALADVRPIPEAQPVASPLPPSVHKLTVALSPFEPNGAARREIEAGDDAFEAATFPAALHHYEAAKRIAPRSLAARTGVLRARLATRVPGLAYAAGAGDREVDASVGELDRLAVEAPAFGPALFELGRGRLILGDADAALPPLQRAARLLPDEAEVHSALGVALVVKGRFDQAAAPLSQAAAKDARNPIRHGDLGTVLMLSGRTQEAVAEYDVAVRLDPSDGTAHADLGGALLALNDAPRAEQELRRAVSLEPTRAAFHASLGYAIALDGHPADAIAEYRTAVTLDPSLVNAWINLGSALASTKSSREEARAALMRARALAPDDPRVKANLDELDATEAAESAATEKR